MRKIRNPQDLDFDRLLSGVGPSTAQEDPVARFVGSARRVAALPPSESTEQRHLSAILETAQLFVEKGNPVARPASNAAAPDLQASGLPKRRRKFVLSSLFATLAAKLAAGGIAVAMATTGGLAAAGNLPAPAQDAISMAAEKIGLHIPAADEVDDTVDDSTDLVDDSTDLVDDTTEVVDDVTDVVDDADDPVAGETKGNAVSQAVHDAIASTEPGPERGKAVSEAARNANGSAGKGNQPEAGRVDQGVLDAVEGTEPGPGRGKAVSEAARQNAGGAPDEGDGDEGDNVGAAQAKRGRP
jgi:hypothetical protein